MKYRYTCKKGTIDHRDYVIKLKTPNPRVGVPVSKVDLRPQCPGVYDQGDLGSCVSNGTSFSIQFDQTKQQQPHQFTPSRLFIYYNTRVIEQTVNEDSGTTIRGAMMAVNKQGACPETLWPYVVGQYRVKPSVQAYASGLEHLVKVYSRVQLDLTQMKQCLIDGYPFVFGILLYDSFERVGANGLVSVPTSSEPLLGGHCMACVGFDDAQGYFIIRNSWGDTWGDHGYCYIPYGYLTNSQYTFDLWTIRNITDTEGTTNPINQIKTVLYGKKKKYLDVTKIFKDYFNSGQTSSVVSNQLFTDPCPGTVKELQIIFINGRVKVFPERSTVLLTNLVMPSEVIQSSNVTKAVYGKNRQWLDVTTIVRDQFSQGYPQIAVGNQLFTDPCPGVVKELRLTLINGVTKTFREGQVVSINEITV